MKKRVYSSIVAVLTLIVVAGPAAAMEMKIVPDEQDLPFNIRHLGRTNDGQLLLGVLLRDPDCLANPPGPCPLLVEGFTLWQEGAAMPSFMQLMNQEGETLTLLVATDPSAPPIMTGTVESYLEVYTSTPRGFTLTVQATGYMGDDPNVLFTVRAVHNDNGQSNVELTLKDKSKDK
jgi:hypothetical protein